VSVDTAGVAPRAVRCERLRIRYWSSRRSHQPVAEIVPNTQPKFSLCPLTIIAVLHGARDVAQILKEIG
jgi:hypothetical protein